MGRQGCWWSGSNANWRPTVSDPCVMVVDAGTGSARVLAFDLNGNQIACASREWTFPTLPQYPGSRVFDTAANWALISECIRETASSSRNAGFEISAVTASSMREGMVLYDAARREIWGCPNIDARAVAEADELVREGLADRIYRTGGDWLGIISPPRFRWLARHEPEVLGNTRHVSMLSDWVLFKLSGELVTDPSCGSSSGLFDLGSRTWSAELIGALGLAREIFPPVVECGRIAGTVTKQAAVETALPVGCAVVSGGADTQLALLGSGCVDSGALAVVGGTFWQTAIVSGHPMIDPQCRVRTLCHVAPGTSMTEGIGFLNGLAMRWLRDTLFESGYGPEDRYVRMDALASDAAPGSEGIFAVVSNVMNARCWIQPPLCFVGIESANPRHTGGPGRAAMVRSIQESAAFTALAHYEILRSLTSGAPERLVFCGGASKGRSWPRIMAEVFDMPVAVPKISETTSLGAAFCAISALPDGPSIVEAAQQLVCWDRTEEPDRQRVEAYREIYEQARTITAGVHEWMLAGRLRAMWRAPGAIMATTCPGFDEGGGHGSAPA